MSAARYAATLDAASSPREIEIRAFRHVNALLATAQGGVPQRATALHKVYRLWAILLADLLGPGNRLPEDLKAQLISLGLWAQRESVARLSDQESLQPLMALHRDLIEALEGQGRGAVAPSPAFAPALA